MTNSRFVLKNLVLSTSSTEVVHAAKIFPLAHQSGRPGPLTAAPSHHRPLFNPNRLFSLAPPPQTTQQTNRSTTGEKNCRQIPALSHSAVAHRSAASHRTDTPSSLHLGPPVPFSPGKSLIDGPSPLGTRPPGDTQPMGDNGLPSDVTRTGESLWERFSSGEMEQGC
ncbi:hypothetical protein CDAR_204831 [Caerostris darwini]|uniref:Uncharacterized protein n=1 Tax=Caerostris darwini TaxID=1538125 RepID=A0AAV4PDM3_9ARAC|nr:hypothetical protein CDAR_204831 [Caerostris darwini]